MTMKRAVIFTGDVATYSVRRGIGELVKRFPEMSWLVVEHRPPRRWRQVLRNQIVHFRRDGLRWIIFLAASMVSALSERLARGGMPTTDAPGKEYELKALLNHSRVSFMRTPDIHSEATVAAVRRFDPDVGIALAAPILKPPLFEIPRKGTLNLHKGRLPDYRGMPPAFWEVWTAAREVGCTVHRVERALDAGPILMKTSIPIEPFSTVRGLQIRLDEIGADLVADGLAKLAGGEAALEAQSGQGKLYRKPTLAQLAAVRAREPGRVASTWRAAVKEAFFLAYVSWVRPLPRLLLGLVGRQRITVLLYHRVCDSLRDTVTVGVEQFERQMNDVRKRCRVVKIEDIVAGRVSRRSLRPIVAVTFDDGYLDNFEYAAPILLRCGIPAAFFVSTGLLDSTHGFPHDLAKLGRAIPAMAWKHVEALQRWGFTLGSHTQTHINCVKGDRAAVDREIIDSKRDLERRLGSRDFIFAYPYGGREDFSDHWRERVRQAGYVGCLSAYGGCNRGEIDSFNVVRTGISHAFGKWAFRSRLEGWA